MTEMKKTDWSNRTLVLLITGLIVIMLIVVCSTEVSAATYYVKPTGDDTKHGLSVDSAWEHVIKACTTLTAGDTVFIAAGTYNEDSWDTTSIGGVDVQVGLVSENNGSSGNEIVFKGYNAIPLIQGLNGTSGSGPYRSPAVLTGKSYIIYDSIEFRYGRRGILMESGSHITIRNCIVDSTIGPDNNNNGGFITWANAFGSVTNILIEGCEFYRNGDWTPGGDPDYTAGNTSGIHIYACDTCTFDNNIVHDQNDGIHLKGPKPGGDYDSTKSIIVSNNTIYDCGTGIWALGQGLIEDVEVYNNTIYHLTGAGMVLHIGDDVGDELLNARFYNNTIFCNGTSYGFQSRFGNVNACSIFNNIVYNPAYNAASGEYKAAIGFKNESDTPENFYEDYNLYFGNGDSAAGGYYVYPNATGYTLEGWRTAYSADSGWGTNSHVSDPTFTDTSIQDYTLLAGSYAIDGGRGGDYPTYMGAYEYTGALVVTASCIDTQTTSVQIQITGANIDSAFKKIVLLWSESTPPITRQDSITASITNPDTISLSELDQATEYFYQTIATDSTDTDTSQIYNVTTASEESTAQRRLRMRRITGQ